MLRRHHHDELELNLVIQGTISYVISGRTYSFPKGSLLWLFPKQVHQLVDRTVDARYYVSVFKPTMIHKVCRGALYSDLKSKSVKSGAVLWKVLSSEAFQFVAQVMDSLMENALDADLLNREAGFGLNSTFQFDHGDPDLLNAGLHYLLIRCWKSYKSEDLEALVPELHPAVSKALLLLGELGGALNLKELSRQCGLSESHLSRLFHKQMKIPLNRYRNSSRLSHFMRIYHPGGRLNLTEAALNAGFGSYSQFHKIFMETYSMGPRKYYPKSA